MFGEEVVVCGRSQGGGWVVGLFGKGWVRVGLRLGGGRTRVSTLALIPRRKVYFLI